MNLQFAEHGILYVDDEKQSLKYFKAIFQGLAPIYLASSPEEGYEIFAKNHRRIGLVLCDQRMPSESGIELLGRIRELDPKPLRFLVTAFADLTLAVDALNDGLLYSYLSKPWEPAELEPTLVRALRHFGLACEKAKLAEQNAELFKQLLMADKVASIGILSTGLNHHIRNALTVIRTFHDMVPMQLREELGHEPTDKEFWETHYQASAEEMTRMTTLLNTLSEGVIAEPSDCREEFGCSSAVRSAADAVVESGSVTVDLTEIGDDVSITGNQRQISQMFRLLLAEAVRNAGENGRVAVVLKDNPDEQRVEIRITDDGSLIPEEERKHLFDPFFIRQGRPDELDTGYIASYLTAFQHGGSVAASLSEEGQNSLEIVLPYQGLQRSKEAQDQLATDLLAEDRRTIRPGDYPLPVG